MTIIVSDYKESGKKEEKKLKERRIKHLHCHLL